MCVRICRGAWSPAVSALGTQNCWHPLKQLGQSRWAALCTLKCKACCCVAQRPVRHVLRCQSSGFSQPRCIFMVTRSKALHRDGACSAATAAVSSRKACKIAGCTDARCFLPAAPINSLRETPRVSPKDLNGSLSATQNAPWARSRRMTRRKLAQMDCWAWRSGDCWCASCAGV